MTPFSSNINIINIINIMPYKLQNTGYLYWLNNFNIWY